MPDDIALCLNLASCLRSVDEYPLPIDELTGTKPVEAINLSYKRLGVASGIIIAACIRTEHFRGLWSGLWPWWPHPHPPPDSNRFGTPSARHETTWRWVSPLTHDNAKARCKRPRRPRPAQGNADGRTPRERNEADNSRYATGAAEGGGGDRWAACTTCDAAENQRLSTMSMCHRPG